MEHEVAAEGKVPSAAREVLRFWESPSYFVVLGVGQKLKADVDQEACAREEIPILRRASGGGTVLQGPGCLNFTLLLSLEARPELQDIKRSYQTISDRISRSLGFDEIVPRGTSDLAFGDQKVSGSAQKRARLAFLHHGTLLHAFDILQVARFLREPEKQPEYRGKRGHGAFLTNVPLRAHEIKSRVAQAWGAVPPDSPVRLPPLDQLIREKYAQRSWTERF